MDACLFSLTAQKLNEAAKGFPADSSEVIKWLEGMFRALQHHLEDDPGMEMKHKRLRKCVRDLRSLAQETCDVLENCHENIIQVPRQGLKKWCRARRSKESRSLLGIKEKMDIIRETMVKILSDMESIEEEEKTVVGFDEQVNELVEWLTTRGSSRSKGILGQPGAGKTTLLKEVYNHASVKSCFEDGRFWVGHSSSRTESLLRNIARKVAADGQVQSGTTMADEEQVLHERISNRLKGKSYLIVLDMNINNVIYEWERIKAWFPDEKNGSRILLSCSDHVERREELISSGSEVVEVLEIISLSQDDVWKLFENTFDHYSEATAAAAGASTGTGSSNTSTTIPSQLLKPFVRDYCRRLPSEIVNLGAILSMIYERRREFSDVAAFLETYRLEVDAAGSSGINISEIASEFNQLQGVQKLCFLYLGLFPQGLEIPVRRLIQLWVAEGWIKEDDDGSQEELIISSKKMIQEITPRRSINCNNLNKAVKLTCAAVWEYSVMKSWQLSLYKINQDSSSSYSYSNSTETIKYVRRLSLHSHGILDLFFYSNMASSFPNLRSLTCFSQRTVIGGTAASSSSFPSLGSFKLLTVMDLEDMYFVTQLPEDLGNQVTELRYLGLRRTGLERLPASLGNFKNLQTLDIKHTSVRGIPTAISKLQNLQYLYMDMNDAGVDGISIDVSSLTHLRVLSVVPAGEWMNKSLCKLTNLRKLGIYGDLDLCEDALTHHLPQILSLKSLRLGFGVGEIDVQKILSSLNSINSALLHSLYLERPLQELPGVDNFPKCSLTCLCLKWSQLHQDPMPTLGKLPCLKVLKLLCASYLGKRMVCPAGGFPMLNVLELNMLEGLEEWIVEERAMQELNRLVVHLCKRLEELPERLQDLRKLEELDVAGMPLQFSARLLHRTESDHHQWNLIFQHNTGKDWRSEIVNVTQGRPATWIALELFIGIEENMGEDWRKIQHIRSIIIDGIQMDATSSSPHQP